MRIRPSSLVPLVLVLLSSIAARAEDHRTEESKISASLRIDANQTDRGRPVASGRENQTDEGPTIRRSLVSTQKLAALLSGRGSNNNSRPETETAVELEDDSTINVSAKNVTRENGTRDLGLPIGPEITGIFSEDVTESEETPEELPEAQELKFIRTSGKRRPVYRPPPRRPSSTNRRNVYSESSRKPVIRPPRRPTEVQRGPTEKECTFFTTTVCLEAIDYPHEAILRSLRGNKQMVTALLTDYKSQEQTGSQEESAPVALPLRDSYTGRYENRYESNEIKRRSDSSVFENVEEGFTCPSIVKYARPQLARAASGLWKYIINIGEHTQTLRLEKCSNPDSSCSFISENYRSSCVQVYNYHRLLTWDSKLGLHMDIFKVPTCCSCHVHGYAEIFPPHQKDPPTIARETFPGADFATTSDQKLDFQDLTRPGYLQKLSATLDSTLGSSNKKPLVESAPNRPSLTVPGRTRPKKPVPVPRPFDKLPQQHAPNTRAPGYTGPLSKGSRPTRLTRPPFRRESSSQYYEAPVETTTNSSILNRYSQLYDQQMDASTRLRLQNGGFDDEYQEPQRRINYNYHPIIDFFKPEASMLQSAEPQLATQPAPVQTDANSWRPIAP